MLNAGFTSYNQTETFFALCVVVVIMTKVAVSTTKPSGKVYRIPLRRVYRKTHTEGDPTWKDLYGKLRCNVCKKPFDEGQPYVADYVVKRGKFALVVYHVECPKVKK